MGADGRCTMSNVMRRPVFVSALLAVLLAPAFVTPRTAAACSAGPDFNPLRESEVIVLARVVDMRLAPEHEGFGTPQTVAVWVDLEVEEYLKGGGPDAISALDTSSVTFLDGQDEDEMAAFQGALYWGSGGACGTLNEDPRGQYWLTGVNDEDGVYRLNLITSAFGAMAPGLDDPHLQQRLAAVRAGLADLQIAPAGTGQGHLATSEDGSLLPIALLAITVGLVAGVRVHSSPKRAR